MDDPLAGLAAGHRAAADALVADAGCLPERAAALVRAVEQVAGAKALETVAGTATVFGSVVDARVDRLKQLIDALPATEGFPDIYEVSALFRITVPQARNVIRTYQVRHSGDYRERLTRGVTRATAYARTKAKTNVWQIEFDDQVSFEYALDLLRRRGLAKSVEPDRPKLTITVDRQQKDRFGKDAPDALGCKRK